MHLNEESQRVIKLAQAEARRLGYDCVAADHIFLACVSLPSTSGAMRLLTNLGASFEEIRQKVEKGLSERPKDNIIPSDIIRLTEDEAPFAPEAAAILRAAVADAKDLGAVNVGSEHILLGITEAETSVSGPLLREIMKDQKRTAQIVKDLNCEGPVEPLD